LDKNQIEIKSKKRFLRNFEEKTDRADLFRRFGFGSDAPFAGRVKKGSLMLYRKKAGPLSLFALTARGEFSRSGGRELLTLRFGRCIPAALLWGAWCLMMLCTGALMIVSDTLFSLWFIVPAILFALPLFLFSGREKKRLTDFLQALGE